MNNDQLTQLIQGIGMMTELHMITYQNFLDHKMTDAEALKHTKIFMTALLEVLMRPGGGSSEQEAK